MPSWQKLIRFQADDGLVYHGQPEDLKSDIGELYHRGKPIAAFILHGDPLDPSSKLSKTVKIVKKLLSPLDASTIQTIRALGANYPMPVQGFKKSAIPIVFFKPLNTLAAPEALVPIPPLARDKQTDYEVELAVVIGRDCRDVSVKEALDFVLGYTIAQDISSRGLCALGVQWALGKSFDAWCPIGPALVAASALAARDGSGLKLETRVDGQLKQSANTSEMLYSVAQAIAYLSHGMTLQKGSVIIMGSPAPLEAVQGKPRQWLRDGNVVAASIENIGTLYCTMSEDHGQPSKL